MSLKVTNARRKQRVRNSLRRIANGRPRLSVFRSSKHIYAQVIDDLKGETLASASSLEKTMRESGSTGANIDAAKAVGKLLAEFGGAGFQRLVGERGELGLQRVDSVNAGLISLHPPVVGGAEKLAGERADH